MDERRCCFEILILEAEATLRANGYENEVGGWRRRLGEPCRAEEALGEGCRPSPKKVCRPKTGSPQATLARSSGAPRKLGASSPSGNARGRMAERWSSCTLGTKHLNCLVYEALFFRAPLCLLPLQRTVFGGMMLKNKEKRQAGGRGPASTRAG